MGLSSVSPILSLSFAYGEAELNKTLLNSIPNERSKKAYVQGFYCETITKDKLLILLNEWELRKQFMKVFYNILTKKLLEKMLTVLVTAGKWEENPFRQKFTPRWSNALASAKIGIYIIRGIDQYRPVQFTDLEINQMNTRY